MKNNVDNIIFLQFNTYLYNLIPKKHLIKKNSNMTSNS